MTHNNEPVPVEQGDRDYAEALIARAVLGVSIEDARFVADGIFDFDRAVECVADDRARHRLASATQPPAREEVPAGWKLVPIALAVWKGWL